MSPERSVLAETKIAEAGHTGKPQAKSEGTLSATNNQALVLAHPAAAFPTEKAAK
jgi:hypothetical protein